MCTSTGAHTHTHTLIHTYSELPVTLWQQSIILGQAFGFHMRFEAAAVISMTVWCHVLQSMVSVLQRRQYNALKQKLPTKLHGIKWWSSVRLRRVAQHFLMPQRNVLCLHIQDDRIRLRMMLKRLESGFVSLELSCRAFFSIWPIGATEWEAMEIKAQIRSQRRLVLSKRWNIHTSCYVA